MNKGLVAVFSGPSGSGKDTIIKEVIEKASSECFLSVSATTRAMRQGEAEGVDYYFVSEKQFLQNIENGKMLEYAKYGSNYYGTPLEPVERVRSTGANVFLNIEVQGAGNVRRLIPDAVQIFIVPPSLSVLEKRLRERGTESEAEIKKRMAIAEDEIKCAEKYDYIIINDRLEDAVDDVLAILRACSLKKENMINRICEVEKNA